MSDLPEIPGPIGADGVARCWWCRDDELYVDYHDNEWGRPVTDDRRLFEKICLEGFQAGLSWITILRKRENFRDAFADFDFEKVARFNSRSVEKLLKNEGIIRHRGKIEATINNAKRAIELVEDVGSLSDYFWQFADESGIGDGTMTAQTETSQRLSKDLRRMGWKFVGPTTAYAFMQAMGLVNDHVPGCKFLSEVESARQAVLPKA